MKDNDTENSVVSHGSTVDGFVVLLEETSSGPVWLADGDGDPPRTLRFENALRFSNRRKALSALIEARKLRAFRRGQIVPADDPSKRFDL